jgi:hypothetical protein
MPGKSLFGAQLFDGMLRTFQDCLHAAEVHKKYIDEKNFMSAQENSRRSFIPVRSFCGQSFFSWVRKYRSKNAIFDLYSVIYGRFNSRFTFII